MTRLIQVEADEWVEQTLTLRAVWETACACAHSTVMAVIDLAQTLGGHAAIVGSRIGCERDSYRLLAQLVGASQIRRQFESSN